MSSEHELCELVAQMLIEKAPMLEEYLGMRVDGQVGGHAGGWPGGGACGWMARWGGMWVVG